jgi:hypothetical protein
MPEDFWSGRGRLLTVAAFVLAAALCATAAVAYVVASRNDSSKASGTRVHPTLVFPSSPPSSVTPSPSATASTGTPSPSARATSSPTPAATVAPSTSPSSSPSPRATHRSPRPATSSGPAKPGLVVDAVLDPAQGDTTTDTVFRLSAHATDGDGTIRLQSIQWDAGGPAGKEGSSTACPASGTGDCRDFAFAHSYGTTGWHDITLTITSGPRVETSTLHLRAYVKSVAASPTPSPAT